MFEDEEAGSVRRANHEGEESGLGDGTSVLAADVNKVWRGCVVPVLVVDPVALAVRVVDLVVVVVDDVGEVMFREISNVDNRQILSLDHQCEQGDEEYLHLYFIY